jgi:uncharacterized protein (DUF427 family)
MACWIKVSSDAYAHDPRREAPDSRYARQGHALTSEVARPYSDGTSPPGHHAGHNLFPSQGHDLMHKTVKIPGPEHPITIAKSGSRVVVSVAGHKIADSTDALSFHEASYPEVLYIPRKDVDMSLLERTDHSTYCPYKGECSYYSIPAGGERSVNAVWSYESPYDAVASIKEHVAFYRDRVDSIEVSAQ